MESWRPQVSSGVRPPTRCALREKNGVIQSEFRELVLDLEGFDPARAAAAVARLAFLKVAPEALFIARSVDRYLGYTCLNVLESDGETLVQGWTGVRPEARRQGLATALKLIGAAYAKATGYLRIVTAPRHTNVSSLRTNEKVGFRPVGEVCDLEGVERPTA
jgi:RimJ/RimL family protein N-acetyltransferase